MLISHKHKFLTIDIPKTGSRSLRETLIQIPGCIDIVGTPAETSDFLQHGTVKQAMEGFDKNQFAWHEYKKFTIVRNPWTRIYSLYNYYKKQSMLVGSPGWNKLAKAVRHQATVVDQMFKAFPDDKSVFKHLLETQPLQHEYYTIDGDVAVDHVGVFENLGEEFDTMCETCNINVMDLTHGNKGTYNTSYKDFYDQELIDLVAEQERFTIELKGYDYNS